MHVYLKGYVILYFPFKISQKVEGKAVLSSADWVLSAEELTSKFTSRTKAIVINTPNNPLGKVRHLSVFLFCFFFKGRLMQLVNYLTFKQ